MVSLLREAAAPLALFSGVVHFGFAVVVGLMVLGVAPGGSGAAALLAWAAFSLLVSLLGYRVMEERRGRARASALAAAGMQVLASRVVALYPRPVEDPVVAEVFALYRQAQSSLEKGDYRGGAEAAERGIALADGVLWRGDSPGRAEEGSLEKGGLSWS